MKGIESKSLPRGAVKVEQAAPGSTEMGGTVRTVCDVLTRVTPVDAGRAPVAVHGVLEVFVLFGSYIVVCRLFSSCTN